jgi:hypothetical protein
MAGSPDAPLSLQARLDLARSNAFNGGLPVRRKDGALYALLAECLSICEWVQHEGLETQVRDHLRERLNVDKQPGVRARYVESVSDVYTIVCRYVLGDYDTRANYTRYAVAMREAARRQVRSDRLVDFLHDAGGIMALYNARPNPERFLTSRTLHLNSPVTVPKDGTFTLTLRRDYRGFFDVVALPEPAP